MSNCSEGTRLGDVNVFPLPVSVTKSNPQVCLEGENIPFRTVQRLIRYEQDDFELKLVCSTKSFRHATVWSHETSFHKMCGVDGPEGVMAYHIGFYGEDLFRVRFGLGEFPPKPLDLSGLPVAMLQEGQESQRVGFLLEEDENVLYASTNKIKLCIWKDPFCMTAMDKDGKVFWRQKAQEEIHRYVSDSFRSSAASTGGTENCFECISLRHDEYIYGLGERFDYVERRGKDTDFWNKDAVGATSQRTYVNVPFYWSTKGYGLFLNNYGRVLWDIGKRDTGSILIGCEDDCMDYFVIYGPEPGKILHGYCRLTGFAPVPPTWTFGLWMSRNSYLSWGIVMEVADELRRRGIPADVLHLDSAWFKKDLNCDLRFCDERFPEPEKHMALLKEKGFRVSLWQWNYLVSDTDNVNYVEGLEKGFVAADESGGVYRYPEYVQGVWTDQAVIDFSNPEAARWYSEQIKGLVRMGASAIKTDFGEGIPDAAIYKNIDGRKFHNYYSLIYNHYIYRAVKETSADGIVWARSGTAGSQRYPIHWSGDAQCSWEGLYGTLKAILSSGLSGIPFFSHDIGGFIGRPSSELYIRWAQLGFFSSHSRCHGMGDDNSREPWSFGDEACGIFRKNACLRYRLLPYIVAQARKCSATGLPFARAMVLEYPDDRNVLSIDDQYLFGEDLLVAPVLAPLSEKDTRPVYLPKGRWVDFWTGAVTESEGKWIDRKIDLDEMPVFVKSSAILPYGDIRMYTGNAVGAVAGLEIYPDASGRWEHEDGENRICLKITGNVLELEGNNRDGVLKICPVGNREIHLKEASCNVSRTLRELV